MKNMVLFIAMICVLLLGCSKDPAKVEQEKKDVEISKYNSYIDLYNVENVVYTIADNYIEYVGDEKNYKAKDKGFWYGGPSVSLAVLPAIEEAEKYIDKEPKMIADSTAKELVGVMRPFYSKIREAREYYNMKKYEKDQFKRGEELHKEIWALYDKYFEASEKFYNIIIVMNKEQAQKDLIEMEKDGHLFTAAHLRTILAAKDVSRLIYNSVDANDNFKIDSKELKPLYDKLAVVVAELEKYSTDATVLEKEGTKQLLAITIAKSAKQMLDNVKALINSVENPKTGTRQTESDNLWKIKLTVDDIDKDIKNIIDKYNTWYQL